MKKIIYIIIYIIIITASGFYIKNKYSSISIKIDNQILSGSNISFTGNTFSGSNMFSGSNINSGTIYPYIQTEIEKFEKMKKDGFIRLFNPPQQPVLQSGLSYQEKSNKLNDYLTANNFYFQTTNKISDGYLYVELAKPIGNKDIFLYWYDSNINGYPMSGKIAKEDNLILGSESNYKFLYKINNIGIYRFYDGKKYSFDWLNTTLVNVNSIHFIGGYTTTSDGNYIKNIIITGK